MKLSIPQLQQKKVPKYYGYSFQHRDSSYFFFYPIPLNLIIAIFLDIFHLLFLLRYLIKPTKKIIQDILIYETCVEGLQEKDYKKMEIRPTASMYQITPVANGFLLSIQIKDTIYPFGQPGQPVIFQTVQPIFSLIERHLKKELSVMQKKHSVPPIKINNKIH